jgi:hypothetical protein
MAIGAMVIGAMVIGAMATGPMATGPASAVRDCQPISRASIDGAG